MGIISLLGGCTNEEHFELQEEKDKVPEIAYLSVWDTTKIVDMDKAQYVADAFNKKRFVTIGSRKNLYDRQVSDVNLIKSESGDSLFYVVNYKNNQGYVLVSATQNYEPVLAFSDEGNFKIDKVEEYGVSMWMKELEGLMYNAKTASDSMKLIYKRAWLPYNSRQKVSSETRSMDDILKIVNDSILQWTNQGYNVYRLSDIWSTEEFNSLPDRVRSDLLLALDSAYPEFEDKKDAVFLLVQDLSRKHYEIAPLLRTKWQQTLGYNQYTPYNYPAGCVAVAMGQIMKYHEYPVSYAWNEMMNEVATPTTARLLAEIGENVDMVYTSSGSGSTIEKAVSSLKNDYGYSTSTIISHDPSKIENELNEMRPVYMRGEYPPEGGHAWVCDGYFLRFTGMEYAVYMVESTYTDQEPNEVGYVYGSRYQSQTSRTAFFHMNWGWGGKNDGYFLDNNITIPDYNFSVNRRDIINISPGQ